MRAHLIAHGTPSAPGLLGGPKEPSTILDGGPQSISPRKGAILRPKEATHYSFVQDDILYISAKFSANISNHR